MSFPLFFRAFRMLLPKLGVPPAAGLSESVECTCRKHSVSLKAPPQAVQGQQAAVIPA